MKTTLKQVPACSTGQKVWIYSLLRNGDPRRNGLTWDAGVLAPDLYLNSWTKFEENLFHGCTHGFNNISHLGFLVNSLLDDDDNCNRLLMAGRQLLMNIHLEYKQCTFRQHDRLQSQHLQGW